VNTIVYESDQKPYGNSNSSPDNKRHLVLVPPIQRVHGYPPGRCDVSTHLGYHQILFACNVALEDRPACVARTFVVAPNLTSATHNFVHRVKKKMLQNPP
jgi:hypothetical protein